MRASVTQKRKFQGPQFKHGKDVFSKQLAQLPSHLTKEKILEQFRALHEEISQNAADYASKSVMERAELLAPKFPICAYGYPKTYILFLAGKVGLQQIEDLLSRK